MNRLVRCSLLTVFLTMSLAIGVGCSNDRSSQTDTPLFSATSAPNQMVATSVPDHTVGTFPTVETAPTDFLGLVSDTAPEELLEESSIAMQELETLHMEMDFRMELDINGTGTGLLISINSDIQGPDEIRGTIIRNFFGAQIEKEFVLTSGHAYLKTADDQEWQSHDVLPQEIPSNLAELIRGPQPHMIDGLALLGQEELNGRPVFHFSGGQSASDFQDIVFANGELEGRLNADIWIRAKDMLMEQIDLEGQVVMLNAEDLFLGSDVEVTGDLAITIRFSEYGRTVSVEAPENVSSAAIDFKDIPLESLLPNLTELPEGLVVLDDGPLQEAGALGSYIRTFGAEDMSVGEDLSPLPYIGIVVQLFANASNARFAVEFKKALGPGVFAALASSENSEPPDPDTSPLAVENIGELNLGDAATGVQFGSETDIGDLANFWLFFAKGPFVAEVVVIGPSEFVDLQQTVKIAQLIEEKIVLAFP